MSIKVAMAHSNLLTDTSTQTNNVSYVYRFFFAIEIHLRLVDAFNLLVELLI